MSGSFFRVSGVTLGALFLSVACQGVWNSASAQCPQQWLIHDMSRPHPRVIDPGSPSTQEKPGRPPSDAIVLFDGKDLSAWRAEDGGPAKWKVRDGYFETVVGTGPIHTVRAFGDCQLHVEWAAPKPAVGKGQDRGNSGVFLMGKYEVQVLDSYQNDTYADGQAAAVYGQYPPLVNACRPPGEWQTYDIIFHAPRFSEDGRLLQPARMTVLHNGVLVQDNVKVLGPTMWMSRLPYEPHPDKLPLLLQDHAHPVRFRNIWIRELPMPARPVSIPAVEIVLPDEVLDRYVGKYELRKDHVITVEKKDGYLNVNVWRSTWLAYFPTSETKFFSKKVDTQIEFHLDKNGKVEGLTLHQGGSGRRAQKIQ